MQGPTSNQWWFLQINPGLSKPHALQAVHSLAAWLEGRKGERIVDRQIVGWKGKRMNGWTERMIGASKVRKNGKKEVTDR